MSNKLWELKLRIDFLSSVCFRDPGDYMARFELDELRIKHDKLIRIERLGLKLIEGGKHLSNLYTDKKAQ